MFLIKKDMASIKKAIKILNKNKNMKISNI